MTTYYDHDGTIKTRKKQSGIYIKKVTLLLKLPFTVTWQQG